MPRGPRRRLGRLRRMTRTGWVRGMPRSRRLDPVRGGQHRRRKTREPQLPARASRPRLSCLPPHGRHCLCTMYAAARVRVSDYLRLMDASGRTWAVWRWVGPRHKCGHSTAWTRQVEASRKGRPANRQACGHASAARARNFWLVQPFSMNGPTDVPGADDLVVPCTRVGPPRTPFAGGPVRAAGASGARVTHDSVGRFADLATDITK
jgi:hypothetical protein